MWTLLRSAFRQKNHVFPHLNGRMPTSLPTLTINKDLNTIDDILNIEWDDIELTGYKAQPDFKDKPGMAI